MKLLWSGLLTLVLFLASVSALSTTLKTTYDARETIVFEIQGVILEPIVQEDIILKRSNVQVPWEYEVQRVHNKWFVWGVAPQNAHNYTLYIEDVATMSNGLQTVITHNQTFEVTKNTSPYTLRPGFFSTLNAEFEGTIILYLDTEETITLAGVTQTEYTLEPGVNEFALTLPSESSAGWYSVSIGRYTVPVYLSRDLVQQETEENESEEGVTFVIAPDFIESILIIDAIQPYPITLYNPSEESIYDLSFTYNSDVFIISPESIAELSSKETREIILTPKTTNIPIDEVLVVRTPFHAIEIPILITYATNQNETGTGYLNNAQLAFCRVQGGEPCFGAEVCSGDTVASRDYVQCCLGECAFVEEETSSWGATIGWLIGALALIIIVIVGARYFKRRSPKVKSISKPVPTFGKRP